MVIDIHKPKEYSEFEKSVIGAAHSHRTTFWSNNQLTEKLETVLIDIIGIIFYMTNLIVQV